MAVLLNGTRELGRFQAAADWHDYTFTIDSGLVKPNDVVIEIRSDTGQLAPGDPRRVGVLLDRATVRRWDRDGGTNLGSSRTNPFRQVNEEGEPQDRSEEVLANIEQLKEKKNRLSGEIGKLRKSGGDAAVLMAEGEMVSEAIRQAESPLGEIEARFAAAGLTLPVALSTNYLETLRMMSAIGLGWSLLPEGLMTSELRGLEVEHPPIHRPLGYLVHKSRTLSNAARAMIGELEAAREPEAREWREAR